jgi:hypothetical protein
VLRFVIRVSRSMNASVHRGSSIPLDLQTGMVHNARDDRRRSEDAMKRAFAILAAILITVLPALAEEEHDSHGEAAEHHGGGHHAHQNELALFLGGTDEHGHDTEFTIGLEYYRSVSPEWAIGGIAEYAGGELRNTMLLVPVQWKPVGGLILTAGPGVEFHQGRGSGDDHHVAKAGGGEVDEDATYFVFRLGAGYAFHVGDRYSIMPNVNLDLVEGEEVWVWGMVFGVMF